MAQKWSLQSNAVKHFLSARSLPPTDAVLAAYTRFSPYKIGRQNKVEGRQAPSQPEHSFGETLHSVAFTAYSINANSFVFNNTKQSSISVRDSRNVLHEASS